MTLPLDPQSLVVQRVGAFVGSPSLFAGKLPYALFGKDHRRSSKGVFP